MPTTENEVKTETVNPLETRVRELEAELKSVRDKHDYQERRADEAERKLKAKPTAKGVTEDNVVILDGKVHPIVNTYRADNTNADVKRGYVPENETLVHIGVQHAGFTRRK